MSLAINIFAREYVPHPGISDEIERLRRRASETEANALSVRMKLQADCLAGVWGYHTGQKNLLEPGDTEEGLRAAQAIGDDLLQKRSKGMQTRKRSHTARRNRGPIGCAAGSRPAGSTRATP